MLLLSWALLQVASSAAEPQSPYDAVMAQVKAYNRAVEASLGLKPSTKNGTQIGDFRVENSIDTMTDQRSIGVTTRAIGRPAATLTVRCSAAENREPEFIYRYGRILWTANRMMTGRARVDQASMSVFSGPVTRDFAAVSVVVDIMDMQVRSGATPIFLEMAGGSRMRLQANPTAGQSTDDVFSLRGFARAMSILPCMEAYFKR